MKNRTQVFVDEIISVQADKILSIEIIGSRVGENNLAISDLDFLIICKGKKDIGAVFETALQAQEKIFGIKPTKMNLFIQKFFLGSNSYNGIHLIIVGRDEFDDNFRPVSFRLKFMTKLIGRNIFLYEIKQNHFLFYGENFVDKIKIEYPGFLEKLACFLFPCIILLFLPLALFFSLRAFKIWCFKTVKYHNISLRAFAKITKRDYAFGNSLVETAKFFRYKPDEYQGNSAVLYFRVWGHIFRNLPFIFGLKRFN